MPSCFFATRAWAVPARKLLNYETKVSLSDGVKKTYDYIKKRGPKDFNYRLTIEIDNDLTPDTWKNKEI